MGSITIQPKPKKKKWVSPKTMIVEIDELNDVKIYAIDSFWDAWENHHFDLSLILTFYKEVSQCTHNQIIKITDGKNVIIGERVDQEHATLINGYILKSIHSELWASKNGFIFTAHRQVRIGIDHKRHFIDRYKKRNFDLSLVAIFIIRVPMGKLGQRIKIVSKNDILIGTRTTQYGGMLISGMVRGEMDFEDYVDVKMQK